METARDILGKREANMKRLEKEAPNLYHGFSEFITYCFKPGALDRKQKELMAVAATVAVRCIPCLAHHANNAIKAGATRNEVLEAATIGVEVGGGPSLVVVRDSLLDFLDDIGNGL
jgi:AhpD family alkylhydroperoxidase